MSDSQQQHIIAIAGVVAVIGPLIALIGTLINSVGKVIFYGGQIVSLVGSITTWMGTASTFITGTMIPAITGVVTAIGPFLLIAAAVIAVITAIIVVIKNWDAIVEVAQFVWESFCEKVSQLVTAFKEFFTSAFRRLEASLQAYGLGSCPSRQMHGQAYGMYSARLEVSSQAYSNRRGMA